jgi:hypothetical protein
MPEPRSVVLAQAGVPRTGLPRLAVRANTWMVMNPVAMSRSSL